ncbi:MAG: nucleotide exchange factor GrpE [Actinomycetota bacterium]
MNESGDRNEQEEPRVVIRDKRRIDPVSGAVRPEAATAAPTDGPTGPPADPADALALRAALDERTSDLQRLKAEFDNYRKRVERDRVTVAEQAQGSVLAKLIPVLDDIDRARSHGEMTGGFKVVADALESAVEKVGLLRFGEEGDPFDPSMHEAVMHSESPDVDGPTCVSLMRSGYRFRDRLLRPAMVAVAEPPSAAAVGEKGSEIMDALSWAPDDATPDDATPEIPNMDV